LDLVKFFRMVLAGGLAGAAVASGGRAVAQQTNVSISMQAAPPAPHIGGAAVVGVRTGTPLLFTVAVTGTRPMTFSATGLPDGVTLDEPRGDWRACWPRPGRSR
jgi:alpha-galactosidase